MSQKDASWPATSKLIKAFLLVYLFLSLVAALLAFLSALWAVGIL